MKWTEQESGEQTRGKCGERGNTYWIGIENLTERDNLKPICIYMDGFYYISNKSLPKFKPICDESRRELAFLNRVMNNSSYKSSWFVYFISDNSFF